MELQLEATGIGYVSCAHAIDYEPYPVHMVLLYRDGEKYGTISHKHRPNELELSPISSVYASRNRDNHDIVTVQMRYRRYGEAEIQVPVTEWERLLAEAEFATR